MHKSLTKKVRKRILILRRRNRSQALEARLKNLRRRKVMMVVEAIVTAPLYYPVVISYGYSSYLESNYECPTLAYLFGLIIIQALVWIFLTGLIKKIRRLCQ